jgi:hypothetical protein
MKCNRGLHHAVRFELRLQFQKFLNLHCNYLQHVMVNICDTDDKEDVSIAETRVLCEESPHHISASYYAMVRIKFLCKTFLCFKVHFSDFYTHISHLIHLKGFMNIIHCLIMTCWLFISSSTVSVIHIVISKAYNRNITGRFELLVPLWKPCCSRW